MADPLAAARVAIEGGEWNRALDLLAGMPADAGGGEAFELRAQACYATGRFEAAVSAWEDRYAGLLVSGPPVEAARAAAMVALYLLIDSGLMAPVRAWLRRADRLLEGSSESPAGALVALVRTYERFMCGDLDGCRHQAGLAIDLGERQGVVPAVVIGRVASARLRILDGDVEAGIEQLDDVALVLMSGEVDPLTTGMMYCELVCAAQGLALHDRAREWTEVMDRWRGAAIGGISGRCRVHRAEILRVCGPCGEAEREALAACDELRPWMRREFGWPLVELGNIRLRKGDLDGAEEAFVAAHQHVWTPHPGLALLRLAQGDIDGATALIADAIAHPVDVPSKERPPIGDLRLVPLLDAQVEIATAAGDVGTARGAASRLRSIAARYRTPALHAGAALAGGRVALLEGALDEAVGACGAAVAGWAEVGAPFEAAVARTVLGEAHHRAGRGQVARAEWRAAQAAFTAFGASRWAQRAGDLAAETPHHVAPPTASRGASATFRSTGELRVVGFGDERVVVRDLKGLRYIARLIAQPGRELHVLDLVAVEAGTLRVDHHEHGRSELPLGGDRGLPILDDEARSAYQRRLADIDDDIDEATQHHDTARLALAQRDRDYLVAELARAAGLRGYGRTTGGSAERARTSVTRSIRYALDRLAEHDPTVAAHLTHSIRTGTYCSYAVDPAADIEWEV